MREKFTYILILVILLKMALTAYGISWGAPDRWNLDERINVPLKMVAEKTFFHSTIEPYHPIAYYYFLMLFLAPYFLALKLMGFDLCAVKSSASISWLAMTKTEPAFTSGLLLAGRVSSIILGILTVYVIYLTAKKMFDRKTAIFSSLALSFNTGFLGTNHFVKNENLSLFLLALVLYIWVSIFRDGFYLKKFYLSCFLSGLAISTKLDSLVILCGLSTMAVYGLRSSMPGALEKSKFLLLSLTSVLAGILIGYPRLIVPVYATFGLGKSTVNGFSVLFGTLDAGRILCQAKYVFLNLVSGFNIVISVFMFIGIIISAFRFKKTCMAVYLLYAILIPYYVVNIFLYNSAATKLIILSVPLLSIFAGYGLAAFWERTVSTRNLRNITMAAVLIYSVIYAVRAGAVFAGLDTRYISTKWIEANIPAGSSIDIIQEPELLFSSRLIDEYKIYCRGERLSYDVNLYPKMRGGTRAVTAGEANYMRHDYVVASSWDFMRFETGGKDSINKDLCDKEKYELVNEISCREDLLLNPRPSYTSPTIFIFKRRQGF